ncbi:KAT8 regulatory NSL complex subunit 3 [Hordeum vulgare]|nr:KAT8 regulatory NSL complex subunit 3 [Hordeum vulgare]
MMVSASVVSREARFEIPHYGDVSLLDYAASWKEMVKDALDAIEVVTFDYPYMSGGKRRPPPKADKLVDHHLSVVKNVVAEHPGHPLVLMRKSMGSSCMVASSDGISASAVICLGYPLKLNTTIHTEMDLDLHHNLNVVEYNYIESQTKEVVPFVLYFAFFNRERKG